MKAHSSVRNAAFDELEDLHDSQKGCALSKKVSMVRADLSYHTRWAQGQAEFALSVFSQEETENSVSFQSSVMLPGASGPIFVSNLCSVVGTGASERRWRW